MIGERNVANMLIVKNVNTTISAGTNVSAELAGMNTGESIITTPGGVV